MKTPLKLAALALLLSAINAQLSTVLAQGSLTPPGAPAPTMKSLDQIEARTPISSLPYTITTGGSYYLTGNLTAADGNCIVIAASGVTLDLNGYTLYSSVTLAQNGGTAIALNNNITHVSIQNGHIFSGVVHTGLGYFGSGFGSGIVGGASDITVRNVSVSGCLYQGISVGSIFDATLVESCQVQTVGSGGIHAGVVRNSIALDCGGDGISCNQAFDSRGESTVNGNGLYASRIANNCDGSSQIQTGVYTLSALNSYGDSSSGTGLFAGGGAQNCYGYSSSGSGMVATTAQNCYGYSNGSGYGIFASTAQNCYSTSVSGTGLSAFIANVCHGISTSGTPMSLTHNVNSF
jgi:hypothetical protein